MSSAVDPSDFPIRSLNIVVRPVAALKPYPGNARKHSRKQITQIEASIRTFGFINPVLIDADDNIIAGHGRVMAAKNLGMQLVPTVSIDALSDAQRRAYIIADNRLAELAGWDPEILRLELQGLDIVDLGFDIEVTGFSTAEIDIFLDANEPPDPLADKILQPKPGPSITKPGDLWVLGRHKLLCGDARSTSAISSLMGSEVARMVFVDPPYNVPIDGHVSGKGSIRHREFVMASGEMTADEFTQFLEAAFARLAGVSHPGAIHFVCMDWRHLGEIINASASIYGAPKNVIVWAKDNAGMGSFYRSQHELIFAFKSGKDPHINNFGLGENGRYRTNVWTYSGVNAFGPNRDAELAMHPTVKPVALVADAIRDVSQRNDIVLDTFAGSGTTLIAAHKTNRRARLLELDPAYCDVIIRRFEAFTQIEAVDSQTRETFSAKERAMQDGK